MHRQLNRFSSYDSVNPYVYQKQWLPRGPLLEIQIKNEKFVSTLPPFIPDKNRPNGAKSWFDQLHFIFKLHPQLSNEEQALLVLTSLDQQTFYEINQKLHPKNLMDITDLEIIKDAMIYEYDEKTLNDLTQNGMSNSSRGTLRHITDYDKFFSKLLRENVTLLHGKEVQKYVKPEATKNYWSKEIDGNHVIVCSREYMEEKLKQECSLDENQKKELTPFLAHAFSKFDAKLVLRSDLKPEYNIPNHSPPLCFDPKNFN